MDKNAKETRAGKFYGERMALQQAWEADLSGCGQDSFGLAEDYGYYFHSYSEDGEPVFGRVDAHGFVFEITAEAYFSAEAEHNEREESAE